MPSHAFTDMITGQSEILDESGHLLEEDNTVRGHLEL